MSGVTFRIEQQSDKKVVLYLQSITPRLIVEIRKALKSWIYAGARLSVTNYFVGGSSITRSGVGIEAARGAAYTKRQAELAGSLLHSRTGTLRRSIIASVDSGMTETGETITATWGAATPYARIQEYGGYAGRGHKAYIPPRPYLGPALQESRPELIASIQQAVEKALATK